MTIGRVSLSKVINKDFVTTIQKMSVKSTSATSSASSSTDWSSTLQSGARIYANSVSSLNSLISYLNVSKDTLNGLLDLTDGMLELAQRAKKTSLGAQSRRKLDFKYKDLVNDFKAIIDKASKSERNFLTKDGLSKLFSIIGLNTQTSSTIAEVFNEFLFEGDDKILASKDIKPTKQPIIPRKVYGNVVTSETSSYMTKKVTNNEELMISGLTGSVSSLSSVTNEVQNGNKVVSYINNVTGEKITLGNDGYQYVLKDVDVATGFSVVSKYEGDPDFATLFLTDNRGDIIKQLTIEELNYTDVKISKDFKTLVAASLSEDHVEKIQKITFNDNDDSSLVQEIARKDEFDHVSFSNIQISRDGSYIAYRDSEENKNYFLNSENLSVDSSFLANSDITKFGFIDNNKLAVYDGNNISTYEYNSNSFNTLIENVNIDKFVTMNEPYNNLSYIAYSSMNDYSVNVINTNGVLITSNQGDEGNDIVNLSLAYNKSHVIELGIFGKFNGATSENELYRVNGENSTKQASSSAALTKVFDSSLNLKTAVGAYRVENALKALKEQIQTNISTMDKMYDVIGENLDLVRATGYALLDLSQESLTSLEADDIAKKLRHEITKNASKALAQAENLEPLAIAAMMLNDEI